MATRTFCTYSSLECNTRRFLHFDSYNLKGRSMLFVRRFVSVATLATAFVTSLSAQAPQPSPAQPTPQQQQKAQPKCAHNGTCVNSTGWIVKRPENCSAAPQGATAQCRDGSYSFSQSRPGLIFLLVNQKVARFTFIATRAVSEIEDHCQARIGTFKCLF